MNLNQLISEQLGELSRQDLLRQPRVITPISPTKVRIEGHGEREFLNFASNNYLGLTHHPRIIRALTEAVQTYGAGSGAAALMTGYTDLHRQAEQALARWKGTEDAVLLPSGYQANHAAVQALTTIGERSGGGVRFLIDKLAHASLIDAVRAAGERRMRVYPHNHYSKLERLLREAPNRQIQVVLTESIFSMDGDAVDLKALAELKRKYQFVLVLDEAHASGVYGPQGSGWAAELGLGDHVDVSVVTLSKALGGVGGAVCGSRELCDAVINLGRAYVYSTSVPVSVAAATLASLDVLREEPQRRSRVRELARNVRRRASEAGFDIPAGDSPIIPVVVGDERSALMASQEMLARGLLVPAVRPPTVAKGASRLRVTLSCEHTEEEVGRLVQGLTELRRADQLRMDAQG